jgi:hypothetical protein
VSETKHTPGPWTTDEADHDAPYQNIKIQASNRTICTVWIDDAPVRDFNTEQQANARRIVACVNACEGLDTGLLKNITTLGDTLASRFRMRDKVERDLQAQRDELLTALQLILSADYRGYGIDYIKGCANAAISKATGSK